ncbi:MAG: YggS family pyridoxal phosphate-dependent enzyme [Alkaliphilus sp.]|nr:YggS family pyridoxal phosphate-dependent enzyme [bacterium AH-315-E09]PHS35477.1 MAG: YggS family pyridoxal phosphate-dependent enzyme [Alkaliphilus sp.]
MNLEKNVEEISEKIKVSLMCSNYSFNDIMFVAVTKTETIETVEELIRCGVLHIGESRVQELVRKYEVIGDKVIWHMIGHLQKNKVKYIVDKVSFIHSLDSESLALEIEKRASKIGKVINCLIEVNISGEESKHGLKLSDVKAFLFKINKLKHINIVGLMTMAPYSNDAENSRKFFNELKELASEIKPIDNVCMKYLSMGMSNDFEVALQEGANMIRIGRALFKNDVQ